MMQNSTEHTFESAISANKEAVFRICRIYAVEPLEPEDLFQEVVFQVWKSLESYKGNASINTWIYRIALNVCMSSKLRYEKKKTVQLEGVSFSHAVADDEDQARFEALKACIKGLNEADKSLIVLYLEELPYSEMATILGLTENHVAVKMKRIRAKLFGCITSKLNDYE
ncbi:MAG: sigma-70 family RNA polymerase sigma factor [Marinoscillum sp.]